MKRVKFFMFVFLVFLLSNCTEQKYKVVTSKDKNGYMYEQVTNDPYKARIYTLGNGLKVYLSENKDQPRIQTYIVVRAGSKNEPRNTTGLAHYLEHLMFKGTDEIGTNNWEEESALLRKISELYEEHLKTDDPAEKKKIYAKIDSLSTVASKYAIPSEYAKLITSIGGKGTNAMTVFERTQYQNDIPSNALEKWLMIESERFSSLVLRLFHTELETVYEEFNTGQDRDDDKVNDAIMSTLFKKHSYGTPIIGLGEHLKNPSMVNIHKFWETYYVPNNMAVCLAGDFNSEETIQLIDKHFGKLKPNKELPEFTYEEEAPIESPVAKDVFGPGAEYMELAYRTNGIHSEDTKYIKLLDMILSNPQGGLIDLNLVRKQKVQNAYAYQYIMSDYGEFVMGGKPREGQQLEEVKDLLLGQLDKIKKGDFEDWLIEAVVNDYRLDQMRRLESNYRANAFIIAFTRKLDWIDVVKEADDLSKITKKELVAFVNKYFNDNYVVVYKRIGKDENTMKVEKPCITPIEINRAEESEFAKKIKTIKEEEVKPVFVDFNKKITLDKFAGIDYSYIENTTNGIFKLTFIIEAGKNNDKKIPLALNYLSYIGTSKYTAEDKQKELFKLGLNFLVKVDDDNSYITISGLDESYEKGLELVEHVMRNSQADTNAYSKYVSSIIKERIDARLDKKEILYSAMKSYALYGKKSSYTNLLPEDELRSIDPMELVEIVGHIFDYKHQAFYYGPRKSNEAKTILEKYHTVPATFTEPLALVKFPEQDIRSNTVYLINNDMVQSWVMFLSKDVLFNKQLLPYIDLYNKYYGYSWSSIIFQEIRESKGLAYHSYSSFKVPEKMDQSNYIQSGVETQPDKLEVALRELLGLLNTMKKSRKQFDEAKASLIKSIETERIIKDNIFWTYQSNLKRGILNDYREDNYNTLKSVTIEDMEKFFNEHVQEKSYILLVLGDKKRIDLNVLGKYGKIIEIAPEEVFNY